MRGRAEARKKEAGEQGNARRRANGIDGRDAGGYNGAAKTYTLPELERWAQAYIEATSGGDLTADEAWVEMICDSYADMNIFAGEKVRGEIYAGFLSDVNAAAEAERNTTRGPPMQNAATETGSGERMFSREYFNEKENQEIVRLLNRVKTNTAAENEYVDLGVISEKSSLSIERILGKDVRGYSVRIEAKQLRHILNEHGETGRTDHSMADDRDIAKMGIALKDYDSIVAAGMSNAYVENVNGRNKPAKTVLYEKIIGNRSYYAVQAVPVTKKKTLYIVSAFIGESGYKKENRSSPMQTAPVQRPKNVAAKSSNAKVPQTAENVKQDFFRESEGLGTHSGNGYDGYSMSNNARAAYENGEMPISKWTKSGIIDAVRNIRPEVAR